MSALTMNDHVYTMNDHLYIAYKLAKAEFWVIHKALNNEYNNSADQQKDIAELARLGNIMIRILEARKAL
jgi:hypothetical protein